MASKKANDANMILRANMRRIRKSTGLNQETFYNTYLKNLPFAPGASSGATAANALSEIEKGARPVPDSFLPVYARLGHVSVDQLLTGQDWRPEDRPATYGDVLRLLSDLLSKKAASIQEGGAGISLQDPALVSMLAALARFDRLQRDGFLSAVEVEATLAGLQQYEELQTPLFDGSSASAASLRKLTAEAVQENEENALDKMLRLIRCTAPRKVSK